MSLKISSSQNHLSRMCQWVTKKIMFLPSTSFSTSHFSKWPQWPRVHLQPRAHVVCHAAGGAVACAQATALPRALTMGPPRALREWILCSTALCYRGSWSHACQPQRWRGRTRPRYRHPRQRGGAHPLLP
jgi:hypothetical protein